MQSFLLLCTLLQKAYPNGQGKIHRTVQGWGRVRLGAALHQLCPTDEVALQAACGRQVAGGGHPARRVHHHNVAHRAAARRSEIRALDGCDNEELGHQASRQERQGVARAYRGG